MKSISIFTCNNFHIDQEVSIEHKEKNVGSISPDTDTPTLEIEQEVFKVYNASFHAQINENILVESPENGQLLAFDHYLVSNEFLVFYCPNKNLLFLDIPIMIAKKFIKYLTQTETEQPLKIESLKFDFNRISQILTESKILHFNVEDSQIDSKVFFGQKVHTNTEAQEAIEKNAATYIVAALDINGKERTVGFSQKGALVFYNTPIDLKVEQPYLQLALGVLNKVSN